MFDISDKVFLGTILKTHGVSGEVVLFSRTLASFEKIELELVFLVIDGKPVPFFISYIKAKSTETFIVKFDYIDSVQQANQIALCEVFADENISETIEKSEGFYKYIGYKLFDQQNTEIGDIEDIVEQSSNILFVVQTDEKEYLIPANENLIIKSSRRKKQISMNIPEGLLDL